MGYYYAEKDLFEQIQQTLGTEGHRHPLAFVLEAADDIAYKTADVEDAFKKGCITYQQLVTELRACGQELGAGEEYCKMVDTLEERYKKGQERGVSDPETYAVQNWIVRVQGKLLAAPRTILPTITRQLWRELIRGSCWRGRPGQNGGGSGGYCLPLRFCLRAHL